VQGLFGLATAALALPAGILSDKTARHYVSKLAAALDAVAICFTSSAVLSNLSHIHKFHLISIGALFWGLSVACDSNTDALFADSIPASERSSQFTQLQALSMACLGAGPLIAAAIFHAQGMHLVMLD
jgi:MFS family permease